VPLAEGGSRLIVSIANTYPDRTARDQALAAVQSVAKLDATSWCERHRAWWHAYYPASFLSLPDARLESFYWIQMYKLACVTRADRAIIDTSGPWFQPTPWPYITWDLNVQLAYWPVYASNRLHLGESLVDALHLRRAVLARNVQPQAWCSDSAYLSVTTAQDLVEPRTGDMRYYECVGNLPWAMHNCWLQYRHSMDDDMLREKVYPLLVRSINLYLHMLEEGDDGRLHLPPTFSPEYYGPNKEHLTRDCNFDLALLRWGCQALLWSVERLGLDEPLVERWRDVLDRLADYPVDEDGYRIGTDLPLAVSQRHYSHLLMIYPLYLVNVEQEGAEPLMERSIRHWMGMPGGLHGYSFTGAASMAAAMGRGDEALEYLNGLEPLVLPNGLYKEAGPCLETPLSGAQCIHDMLLQSWGGTIRVFPAVPAAWGDIAYETLRAEGAFLVSARRRGGRTAFVRIKSLAGEPCRIRPNLDGPLQIVSEREIACEEVSPGVYALDLRAGEEALLYTGDAPSSTDLAPVAVTSGQPNSYGLSAS